MLCLIDVCYRGNVVVALSRFIKAMYCGGNSSFDYFG